MQWMDERKKSKWDLFSKIDEIDAMDEIDPMDEIDAMGEIDACNGWNWFNGLIWCNGWWMKYKPKKMRKNAFGIKITSFPIWVIYEISGVR